MSKPEYSVTELKSLLRSELNIPDDEEFPPLVSKQITKLFLEGFSYKEIGRIVYFYLHYLKGKYNPLYGIYFVRTYRQQSQKFWAQKELEQKRKELEAKEFSSAGGVVVFNVRQILKNKKKPYRLEPLQFEDIDDMKGDDDGQH